MEVKIETKYSPHEVVIGYYNGFFHRFRIDNIEIRLQTQYNNATILYHCTALVPKDCECTFSHTFEQHELKTEKEFKEMMENILKESEEYTTD